MFFLMLVNLGLGSMFGTIQGILTPIVDTFKVRKEYLTGQPMPNKNMTLQYRAKETFLLHSFKKIMDHHLIGL